MRRSDDTDVKHGRANHGDLTSSERQAFRKLAESFRLERILVIDPNPAIARLLTSYIAPAWPEIDARAYDPSLGIPDRTFELSDYDIVFLEGDLSSLGADGFSWLDALQGAPNVPPIIMMADTLDNEFIQHAVGGGAAGTLDKGNLSARTLLEAVAGCVDDAGGVANKDSDATEILKALPPVPDSVSNNEQPAPKTVIDRPEVRERRSHRTSGVLDEGLDVEIPGYIIERRIARGNMGEVYLARGDNDSELLALKILRLENEQNRETIQRFMREYLVISKISNPHVVTVHERGFGSNFAFIVMEYCEYGNLKTKLRSPIPPQRALSCLRQIASGLGAAHEIGVLHRDIKPANILFRDPDTLVLTDFGVATSLAGTVGLTMTNSIVGSLYYVSPEQITEDTCGPLSDIYSVGVVLYEMLVSKPPYTGTSLADIMEAHCKAPIPRLPQTLKTLQPLVDGLLAKDPDERFQSTGDIIAGIDWIAESMGFK